MAMDASRRPFVPKRYGYCIGAGLGLDDDEGVVATKVAAGVIGWWMSVHYLVIVVVGALPVFSDAVTTKDATVIRVAALVGFVSLNMTLWHYMSQGSAAVHSMTLSITSLLIPGALTFMLHGDIPVHLLSLLSPATSICVGHRGTITAVLTVCAVFTNIVGAAQMTNSSLISGDHTQHWTEHAVLIGHSYCVLVGLFGSLTIMWYFLKRRVDIQPPMYVTEHMSHSPKRTSTVEDMASTDLSPEESPNACCWAFSLRRAAGILSSIIFLATGVTVTFLLNGSYKTNRREKTDLLHTHASMVSLLKASELDMRLSGMQRYSLIARYGPFPPLFGSESYLIWNYSITDDREFAAFIVGNDDVRDITGTGKGCCGVQNELMVEARWLTYSNMPECGTVVEPHHDVYVHQADDATREYGVPLSNYSAVIMVCQRVDDATNVTILEGIATAINYLVSPTTTLVHDPNRTYNGCVTHEDYVYCHAPTAYSLSVLEHAALPDVTSDIFRLVVLWLIVLLGSLASIVVVAASLSPIYRFTIAAHAYASGDKPLEQMKLPSNHFKELIYLEWAFYQLANAVLEARHLVHPGALDLASLQPENELISEEETGKEKETEERGVATEPTVEEDPANASSSSIIWRIKDIVKKKEGVLSPVPSTPRSPRKAAALNLLQTTENGGGQEGKPSDSEQTTTSSIKKKAVRFAAETKVQHLSPRHVLQSVDAAVLAMNVSRFHVHLRNMKPNAAVDLFSEVFTIAVWAVQENSGTTINISGDRMLALWRYDKTDKACESALKIQQLLAARPRQPISVRIGISGGRVTWGSFSLCPTEGRGMSVVNMLGIPVNKATHLERFNKCVCTSALIDGWVYDRLTLQGRPSAIICRPVEIIYYKRLASRKDAPPTPVYELLAASRFPIDPTVSEYLPDAPGGKAHFAAFNAALEEDWEKAEVLMQQENTPVNTHVARLMQVVKTKRPPIEIED